VVLFSSDYALDFAMPSAENPSLFV